MPFVEAKARLWQTLAILETTADLDRDTVRAMARGPLLDAYRIALELPALPLLRAIVDLATRARIALPAKDPAIVPIVADRDLVAVGPGYFRLPVPGRRDASDRVGVPIGRPGVRRSPAREHRGRLDTRCSDAADRRWGRARCSGSRSVTTR